MPRDSAAWVLLFIVLIVPTASAERVCWNAPDGHLVCDNRMSWGVQMALSIITFVFSVFLLTLIFSVYSYRSNRVAVVEIEASQVQGPPTLRETHCTPASGPVPVYYSTAPTAQIPPAPRSYTGTAGGGQARTGGGYGVSHTAGADIKSGGEAQFEVPIIPDPVHPRDWYYYLPPDPIQQQPRSAPATRTSFGKKEDNKVRDSKDSDGMKQKDGSHFLTVPRTALMGRFLRPLYTGTQMKNRAP